MSKLYAGMSIRRRRRRCRRRCRCRRRRRRISWAAHRRNLENFSLED